MRLQIILEKGEDNVTNLLFAQAILDVTKKGSIIGETVDARKVAKLILCETETKSEAEQALKRLEGE